jgi:hypothetical protein
MTWYEELLAWLAEQEEHDRQLQLAYEIGWRRGWDSLAIRSPWLSDPGCVERAYRDGVHVGLETARINAERAKRVA